MSTCCSRVWKLWPSMEEKVSEGVGEALATVWPCLSLLLLGWHVVTGGFGVQQFVMV